MPRLVCDQKEIAERETWNSSGMSPKKKSIASDDATCDFSERRNE